MCGSSGDHPHSYPYPEPLLTQKLWFPIFLSFVSRRLCVWYAGHGRGEANKPSTDSKHGATYDNYPAHNRPIGRQSLVWILESREIPFPGWEKRSRLSILVNIPVGNSVLGYNKTEANLQIMFNGYIKSTTYSLFPETLETFWWNPFHFILSVFKDTVCWKMYNFFGHAGMWGVKLRTERQTATLEVWGGSRRGN